MRSKTILLSLGFLTGVLLTGCQTLAERNAAVAKSGGDATAKLSTEFDENQPWYQRNARLAARRGLDANAATPTTTTVAAANCGCSTTTAKQTTPTTVQTCSACGAGTNVVRIEASPMPLPNVPTSLPQIPQTPQTLPVVPAAYAPTPTPTASSNSLSQTNASFGPGVQVVSQEGGVPIDLPTGEKMIPSTTLVVRFGQTNNYQNIVGQVYQFRRTWRLRYAAAESEDRFGGSVTLVGDNLDNLKDGQMVRVEGSVVQSDDRSSGARYQVQRFDVIEPK